MTVESVKYKMMATTFKGLEDILAKEIDELGGENIEVQHQVVSFFGDTELMYRSNYWLRTALSILKPIASFKAENEQELYDGLYAIKWYEHFDLSNTFAVDTLISKSNIEHSKPASYKIKDAISNQFMYYFNHSPEITTVDADVIIDVKIINNVCEVSLNSSGVNLSKRGYRRAGMESPINEVLAAGLITLSGWDKKSNFVDPMCGTGTFLIEAALMAYNFPPAFVRRKFSFMNWTTYDPTIWREILSEDLSKKNDFEYRIIGCDISADNLKIANRIIADIKFHKDIELVEGDVSKLEMTEDEAKGCLVTNPPYGGGLEVEALKELYNKLGDLFINNFMGYHVHVLSSELSALEAIGIDASNSLAIINGNIDCHFNSYKIVEGTARKPVIISETKIELEVNSEENNLDEALLEAIPVENEINLDEPETVNLENDMLLDMFISQKGEQEELIKDFSYTDRKESKPFPKPSADSKFKKDYKKESYSSEKRGDSKYNKGDDSRLDNRLKRDRNSSDSKGSTYPKRDNDGPRDSRFKKDDKKEGYSSERRSTPFPKKRDDSRSESRFKKDDKKEGYSSERRSTPYPKKRDDSRSDSKFNKDDKDGYSSERRSTPYPKKRDDSRSDSRFKKDDKKDGYSSERRSTPYPKKRDDSRSDSRFKKDDKKDGYSSERKRTPYSKKKDEARPDSRFKKDDSVDKKKPDFKDKKEPTSVTYKYKKDDKKGGYTSDKDSSDFRKKRTDSNTSSGWKGKADKGSRKKY